jgi:hypothetical protein
MRWWLWLLIGWAVAATVGCVALFLVVKDVHDEDDRR